ncbi:MAG: hypothetical protein RLP02_26780 [Coleofasciculus sp. C2-GNP5-27]
MCKNLFLTLGFRCCDRYSTLKVDFYGHEVEIPGGCRVVYRPDRPQCGAQVWIETYYNVKVMSWQLDESGALIPSRVKQMLLE